MNPADLTRTGIRTFLIADIRGYTRFTQEHGDEAAGRLAVAFAERSRLAVESHGGEVIELRGDEALSVFDSARDALRAAVELQTDFRRGTVERAAFPLGIGIGVDAGEAVPAEGGYRGGALNIASRLCSLAGPGEIFASETVVSLAGRLEGVRFVDRRPVRLKGLDKPVRIIVVVPEPALPPVPESAGEARRLVTKPRAVAAIVGLAALGTILFVAIRPTEETVVPPNSVAVIDPDSSEVVDAIPVGQGPGQIAVAGNALWVANMSDLTLAQIDPATRTRTLTIALPGATANEPMTLAGDPDDLWIAAECFVTLYRMDPRTEDIDSFQLSSGPAPGQLPFASCAITTDFDDVWIVVDRPPKLLRVEWPGDRRARIADEFPLPVGVRSAIALGAGSVWVLGRIGLEGPAVRRINPQTGKLVERIELNPAPEALAFGYGAVWVTNQTQNSVMRIRPATNFVMSQISVGKAPSAIAIGGGAVWVANTLSGTVSRIDPETTTVDETIELGHRPSDIVFHDDLLWVTVRE